MKNLTGFILILAVLAIAPVASAVVINIPADYPTIQEGIDASSDGDTVLVQPGAYVENINFNGHNIVLGSLFLTTGDTSYISTTIIDGDSSGTVVTFESGEDSTAVVTGFSMQNGRAYYGAGGVYISGSSPIVRNNTISGNSTDYSGAGGIYCTNSNPAIINNTISGNSAYYGGRGGGISCGSNSNATVIGNVISGNSAYSGHHEDGGDGGGISCYNSDPTIIDNIITRNSAVSGGGIHCVDSDPAILGNTVINNFGSAISCISSSPTLTNNILWKNGRSEIYADESSSPAFTYCDIWGGWEGEGNIDIDPLFLDPLNGNYNVCSQSPCIDAGDPDMQDPDGTRADIGLFFPEHPECFNGNVWNVSMAGNDTTGDGSPENPFRTIQYAIDTSLHGDTVLVQNGTYVESINLTVKKIVLASNHIYSGDPLDIQNTTVDGNSLYRTLRLWLCDSTVVITGFTFRNAAGPGITCYYSDATIVNNIITGNSAYVGAGIFCGSFSKPRITNNIISGNSASSGGGVYCFYFSRPVITNTILWANTPPEVVVNSSLTPIITYSDIRGGWEGEGNIDVDPLFVNPSDVNFNVCSQSPCIDAGDPDMQDPDGTRADIGLFFPEHPECIFGNVWNVSVSGSDTTGDGSPENPFRTIQHGVDASLFGDSVIVQNGIYVENVNIKGKSISVASNYIFSEDPLDIENTVIDGDSASSVVTFESGEDSLTIITGFTLRNGYASDGGGIICLRSSPTIRNNMIAENSTGSAGDGGGIYCAYSNAKIVNNSIRGNSAESYGGGISCYRSSPLIINNAIEENSSGWGGGGISCIQSGPAIINNAIKGNLANKGGGIRCSGLPPPTISNNVIAANFAFNSGGGINCTWCGSAAISNNTLIENSANISGGGIYFWQSTPAIRNSIFWADDAPEGPEIYIESGSPSFMYCDIQGGWEGEGNIDVDPLFRDPENGDFHLRAIECGDAGDSPCIDAGDPTIFDSIIDCDWGLGGERSDMGAYGGNAEPPTDIETDEAGLPAQFALSQNYPNPFNASTTIQYSLLEASQVKIEIYDILGRKVETLVQGEQPAGYHQVIWDASDQSSGVYFYRIQTGKNVETKKMVLLK